MLRLGCDSANLGALVPSEFVFPYADMLTAESLAGLIGRFPQSTIVAFDRGLGDPLGIASIADVERGALTPAQMPEWVREKHAAGVEFVTIYASPGTMGEVQRHMRGRGGWWKFYADWGIGLAMPQHPAALIQFISGEALGADIDLSVCHNDQWHPHKSTAAMREGHSAAIHLGEAIDALGLARDHLVAQSGALAGTR